MEDAKFLREQAERAFRLARSMTAPDVIACLQAMGDDFQRRADRLEAAEALAARVSRQPPPAVG